MSITETLLHSPLFTGISNPDLEKLLSSITFQTRTFRKGNVIVSRNETCEFLIVLLKGNVKGEMLDSSGKTLKIEDINAPRPLAPAFLFGKNNKYPVDIIANNDVKVMYIAKSAVVLMMQDNEQFLNNFLNVISNRAQFLSEKVYFLSFKTIKAKLANYILDLAKPYKTDIQLPVSHQSLAELFGVTRPSLSRTLLILEKEKAIKVERKNIKILDRNKLTYLIQK